VPFRRKATRVCFFACETAVVVIFAANAVQRSPFDIVFGVAVAALLIIGLALLFMGDFLGYVALATFVGGLMRLMTPHLVE
jgi:hypothetical protein